MVSCKNPEIPFSHAIPRGKVEAGQKFVIKGEVLESAARISVNFLQKSSNQKIFHLDFRFAQEHTVRNTNFPSGTWGPEEVSHIPLTKGGPFKVEIKVTDDHFEVEVNDHHHCNYVHRVKPEEADTFEIKGDVKVKSIKFDD